MPTNRYLPYGAALLALLAAPALAMAAPKYTVVALGANSSATGINDAGQLSGTLHQSSSTIGFVYEKGQLTTMGTLGGVGGETNAINNLGQTTGSALLASGTSSHAYSTMSGATADVGNSGDNYSVGYGINDAGAVAGAAMKNPYTYQATVYDKGGVTWLGTLGGPSSMAYDINAAGQAVGWADVANQMFLYHAFLYSGGQMTDLGTLGGRSSLASAINDVGQVVGWSYNADGVQRAFMYSNGKMNDIGAGFTGGANGINGRGQVVGSNIVDGVFRAFLYQNGATTDLTSLIDPTSGWTITNALDINERGQIAANGCNRYGACQGLLLELSASAATAVPESQTYILMAAGFGLLGTVAVRRRRERAGAAV